MTKGTGHASTRTDTRTRARTSARARSTAALTAALMGAAMLALALLAGGCEKADADGAPAAAKPTGPRAVPVQVAVAERRDVPLAINVIGAAKAFSIVTLKPQISGVILEKKFRVGDPVTEGQLMFVIDPRPFDAALHEAEAKLAQDLAKIDEDRALAVNARADAERMAGLHKQGAATSFETDKSAALAVSREAMVAADDAAVAADRAIIEQARLNLAYTQIHSPIDGYTGPTLTDAGNVVKANETELITVHKIEPIYIECSIPEKYLPAVRRAMAGEAGVTLEARIPGEQGVQDTARLQFINNTVDESTGMIKMRGVAANQHRALWPGQYLNVSVVYGRHANAVLVPSRAIQQSQKGDFVWVVGPDHKAEVHHVTLGDEVGDQTIIKTGVDGGATVVTIGQLRLTPGATVQIVTDTGATVDAPARQPAPSATDKPATGQPAPSAADKTATDAPATTGGAK